MDVAPQPQTGEGQLTRLRLMWRRCRDRSRQGFRPGLRLPHPCRQAAVNPVVILAVVSVQAVVLHLPAAVRLQQALIPVLVVA